jgi:hypothetical protein
MPVIKGQISRFRVYGLYKGMLVLEDLATGSVWQHLTGDCIHGPLVGQQLPVLGSVWQLTAVQAAQQYPQAHFAYSPQHRFLRWYSWLIRKVVSGRRGFIPPPFYHTLPPPDGRLPRLEMGLGVWDESLARFYPLASLQTGAVVDDWHGRELHIRLNLQTKTPLAEFNTQTKEKPLQTFSRWYGFAATFPHCHIF